MSSNDPGQSTPHLFGNLLQQAFDLAQTEVRLFRAELSERVTATVRAAALLAAALVLSRGTMLLLLETCVAGLVQLGMSPFWAGIAITLASGCVVGVLVLKALGDLKARSLAPVQSFAQVRKDFELLRGIAE